MTEQNSFRADDQPKRLFDSDDEDEGNEDSGNEDARLNDRDKEKIPVSQSERVTINRKFAREYQARKEKEELKQVRWENDGDGDDDDSSDEEEDEAAELLTTELDVEILRTIHAVRSKDSRIYDPQARFFPSLADDDDDDDENAIGDKKPKAKPMHYKDVVREQILEQMDRDELDYDDDDNSDNDRRPVRSMATTLSTHRLAYDSTQVELRQAFLDSAAQQDDDEDEDDVIVVKKGRGSSKPSSTDPERDAQAQRQLELEIERLRQTTANDGNNARNLVDHKGEVPDGNSFLLDFFKNRPWLAEKEDDNDDDDDDDADCNTYGNDGAKPAARPKAAVDSDDASLEELDHADDFEAAFNFRFEQATLGTGAGSDATAALSGFDHSNVSYARGGASSSSRPDDPSSALPTLRRPDDSRKLQRLARKERKAAERKAKEEQLKRLKNAKRQEMNSKLQQIQAILGQTPETAEGGGGGGTLDEAAIMKLLEGDFDPDQFEALMAATYNDDFYQQADPEWTSDLAVRESLLKIKDGSDLVGDGEDDNHGDELVGPDTADGGLYDNHDDDGNNEPEYDDGQENWEEEDEWAAGENYGAEDEEEYNDDENDTEITKKVKAKINEELYKLDYEDIVAGIPTRFKYRQVTPNNYGLSTSEILCARDSTLKQFVSLKKLAPYAEQEFHVGSRQRRKFRERLKQEMEEENEKLEQEQQSTSAATAADEAQENETGEATDEKKKRRRRLKKGAKRRNDKGDGDTAVESSTNDEPQLKPNASEKVPSKRLPVQPKSGIPETSKDSHPKRPEESSMTKRKRSKKKSIAGQGVDTKVSRSKMDSDSANRNGKKAKKSKLVEGVSVSRLASYGL